jgi:hypothetical protein
VWAPSTAELANTYDLADSFIDDSELTPVAATALTAPACSPGPPLTISREFSEFISPGHVLFRGRRHMHTRDNVSQVTASPLPSYTLCDRTQPATHDAEDGFGLADEATPTVMRAKRRDPDGMSHSQESATKRRLPATVTGRQLPARTRTASACRPEASMLGSRLLLHVTQAVESTTPPVTLTAAHFPAHLERQSRHRRHLIRRESPEEEEEEEQEEQQVRCGEAGAGGAVRLHSPMHEASQPDTPLPIIITTLRRTTVASLTGPAAVQTEESIAERESVVSNGPDRSGEASNAAQQRHADTPAALRHADSEEGKELQEESMANEERSSSPVLVLAKSAMEDQEDFCHRFSPDVGALSGHLTDLQHHSHGLGKSLSHSSEPPPLRESISFTSLLPPPQLSPNLCEAHEDLHANNAFTDARHDDQGREQEEGTEGKDIDVGEACESEWPAGTPQLGQDERTNAPSPCETHHPFSPLSRHSLPHAAPSPCSPTFASNPIAACVAVHTRHGRLTGENAQEEEECQQCLPPTRALAAAATTTTSTSNHRDPRAAAQQTENAPSHARRSRPASPPPSDQPGQQPRHGPAPSSLQSHQQHHKQSLSQVSSHITDHAVNTPSKRSSRRLGAGRPGSSALEEKQRSITAASQQGHTADDKGATLSHAVDPLCLHRRSTSISFCDASASRAGPDPLAVMAATSLEHTAIKTDRAPRTPSPPPPGTAVCAFEAAIRAHSKSSGAGVSVTQTEESALDPPSSPLLFPDSDPSEPAMRDDPPPPLRDDPPPPLHDDPPPPLHDDPPPPLRDDPPPPLPKHPRYNASSGPHVNARSLLLHGHHDQSDESEGSDDGAGETEEARLPAWRRVGLCSGQAILQSQPMPPPPRPLLRSFPSAPASSPLRDLRLVTPLGDLKPCAATRATSDQSPRAAMSLTHKLAQAARRAPSAVDKMRERAGNL